jgi:hypothetical protein
LFTLGRYQEYSGASAGVFKLERSVEVHYLVFRALG